MFDVITVGSATVDIFISSKSKRIELLRHAGHEDVCMPIGSKILINYLHQDTGGGGTNTATAFARLGLKTGWVGKLGTDMNSRHILDIIKKERITFLGKTEKGETGYSVIIIGIEKDRTILAYKGINDKLRTKDINFSKLKTKWFYFTAMMGESFNTLEKIAKYAKKNKIKVALNPSLYLAQKGLNYLKEIISACNLLVLNKEEAQAITRMKTNNIDLLLKALQKQIPLVVITDGKKGAYAYNGIEKYILSPCPVKVVETTGAGDSFASGFLAGIILKQNLEYALRLGYAEAASVIQHIGAKEKLLSRKEAEKMMKSKPCKIKKVKL